MSESSLLEKSSAAESEFFDRWAQEHGEFNPFLDRGWQSIRTQYQTHVRASNARLLDVGCGTGQSRQLYTDSFSTYTGLDLSQAELDLAARKFPHDRWVRANAVSMPFSDNTFDVVAFSSVLHHIPQMENALKEARRVLRPGGMVFAFDPNLLHPAFALIRHPRSPLYSPKGVSPNECPLLPGQLRRAFEVAGLRITRQRGLSNIPYRSIHSDTLGPFLTLYNFADRLWHLSMIDRWFGAFVITVAQKP